MRLTVSIITPSYQQGKFIERTIQSILSQDVSLEYLIFDGGSSDNTLEILNKYSNQLSWTSEKDHGQTHAVNKGLKKATGDIIGWLNSDDIYYPNVIKTVLAFFENNPDTDIIYGMANHIDANDHVIETYPVKPWNFEQLKNACFICQPTVFFRRSVIEQYGLLNEKLNYCMDYEYWLRLGMSRAKWAYLPILLAGSRLHTETKTLSQTLPATAETNDMLKEKFGYVPDSWILYYAEILTKKMKIAQKNRICFLTGLIFSTLYTSFRWNGYVSKTLFLRFRKKLKKVLT